MAETQSVRKLAEDTRYGILKGHEKYAYVERIQKYLEQGCGQDFSCLLANENDLQASGGYAAMQHPDFLKTDGLPSPFNPDPDVQESVMGEAILNEYSRDTFAKDLSKDALEDKLKNKLRHQLQHKHKLTQQPKMAIGNTPTVSFPRPHP